jgi:hypothetical protein
MQDLNSYAAALVDGGHHPLWWLVLLVVVMAFVTPLAYLLSHGPGGKRPG